MYSRSAPGPVYTRAPAWASSRAPETKSACTCVSIAAARVDHGGLLRAIAADEKRRLRQSFVEEALEHTIEFENPAEMIHPTVIAAVVAAGAIAGGLGSLLGIGGGVFLVPLLNAGLGLDFKVAAATG